MGPSQLVISRFMYSAFHVISNYLEGGYYQEDFENKYQNLIQKNIDTNHNFTNLSYFNQFLTLDYIQRYLFYHRSMYEPQFGGDNKAIAILNFINNNIRELERKKGDLHLG